VKTGGGSKGRPLVGLREREVPVRSSVIAEVGLPRNKGIPFLVQTGDSQLQLDRCFGYFGRLVRCSGMATSPG
jgi:hypothetical protein